MIHLNTKQNMMMLSTENNYLKYLMKKSIPSKLKGIYEYKNMSQVIAIVVSVCAVMIGFLVGLLWKKKLSTTQ